MADEEKHHHRLFHHKDKDDGPKDPEKESKHHKHLEILGGATALAAGAYVLIDEKNKAKKDPENADKHKVAKGVATTVALGAAGLAIHHHHEKKEAKNKLKQDH